MSLRRNTRTRMAAKLGSSPDPRAGTLRFQKRKRKKTKLGKIVEENFNPNKVGILEESICISDGENESLSKGKQPLSSDLSAQKQKTNKVNAAPSGSKTLKRVNSKCNNLKENKTRQDDVDTSEEENNFNFHSDRCDKLNYIEDGCQRRTKKRSKKDLENLLHVQNEAASDHDGSSISSYYSGPCDERKFDYSSPERVREDHDGSCSSCFYPDSSDERECSYSSPERVCKDHDFSSRAFYCESYDDYDISAVDREEKCNNSSPEQVCESGDISQIEFGETAFDQGMRGYKNSTLMDISRAQGIQELSGDFNISNINPIDEDCVSASKRRHSDQKKPFYPTSILEPGLIREASTFEKRYSHLDPQQFFEPTCILGSGLSKVAHPGVGKSHSDQQQLFNSASVLVPELVRSESHRSESSRSMSMVEHFGMNSPSASTLISGKPLYKIRKDKKFGISRANQRPYEIPRSKAELVLPREEEDLTRNGPLSAELKCLHWLFPPEPKNRTKKTVSFCDPLTTEISSTDVCDKPECSCMETESVVPPVMVDLSAHLRHMSVTTNEMFLHLPVLRLLQKSKRNNF